MSDFTYNSMVSNKFLKSIYEKSVALVITCLKNSAGTKVLDRNGLQELCSSFYQAFYSDAKSLLEQTTTRQEILEALELSIKSVQKRKLSTNS